MIVADPDATATACPDMGAGANSPDRGGAGACAATGADEDAEEGKTDASGTDAWYRTFEEGADGVVVDDKDERVVRPISATALASCEKSLRSEAISFSIPSATPWRNSLSIRATETSTWETLSATSRRMMSLRSEATDSRTACPRESRRPEIAARRFSDSKAFSRCCSFATDTASDSAWARAAAESNAEGVATTAAEAVASAEAVVALGAKGSAPPAPKGAGTLGNDEDDIIAASLRSTTGSGTAARL